MEDNLFEEDLSNFVQEFEAGSHEAIVFLKEVPDPERYGVAILDEQTESIMTIVEKHYREIFNVIVHDIRKSFC
ncbi:sugar phosphate nucleotidyltransferase [Neobacillus sp. LXY-1]|uniref:sugar phosphate nucleotidyltransferase n=1 Tax=Neobacillus sp. LXY-1 TaxID=3379133 RepID=UPI003EE360EA